MSEYTLDTRVAVAQACVLKEAVPSASFLYAMKANGHPAIVSALATVCDGADVASSGELEIALASGFTRLVCSGPAKSPAFLHAAAAAGATVNVESLQELRLLGSLGIAATIALRVNRHAVKLPAGVSHKMSYQFGIDEATLPSAFSELASYPQLDLAGFHLHAMSGNLDVNAHNVFVADALEWAAPYGLRQVNLGGGFGVDYLGEREFDPYGLDIPPQPGIEVIFEPGRWLVATAGTYTAEVADIKKNNGTWYVVIRGGMHQFRLPVAHGYSAPFTVSRSDDWPYAWDRPAVRSQRVTVAGELCTPNDILARDEWVDEVRVGDRLVFGKAGAYGWDISPHQYLRHPSPEFVILS
jgi:diaminopimelate decarboxylase